MTKSFKLLHQLLTLVEKFEAENNNRESTMADFAGFLMGNLQQPAGEAASPDIRFGDKEKVAQKQAYQTENNIGRLLVYMSRYAKSYIKKVLEGTPLQTAEDFTCLSILLTHEALSKKDLISRNIQEKTSGTEVIRRLIAAGLVTQKDNEHDKRGKMVSITNEGRQLLYRVFADMNHIGKIVTGKLTMHEKLVLQHLLQKLEAFHYAVHKEKLINTKRDLAVLAQSLA